MSTTSLEFGLITFDNCLRSEEDFSKMFQEVLESYFKKETSEKLSDLLLQIEDVITDEKCPLWKRVLALRLLKEASRLKSRKFASCIARQKPILRQVYQIALGKKNSGKSDPRGRSKSVGSDVLEPKYIQLAIDCVCLWKSKFGKDDSKTAEVFKRLHRKLSKDVELPKGNSMTDSDIEEPCQRNKRSCSQDNHGTHNNSMPELRTASSTRKDSVENCQADEERKECLEVRGSLTDELRGLKRFFEQYLENKANKADMLVRTTGNRKTFIRKTNKVMSELGADILRANTKATMILGKFSLPFEERKFLGEIEREFKLHTQTEVYLQKGSDVFTSTELFRRLDVFFGVNFSDSEKINSQSLKILVPKATDTFSGGGAAGDTPLGTLQSREKLQDSKRTMGNVGSATTPNFHPLSHELNDSPIRSQASPQGTRTVHNSPQSSHKKSPFSLKLESKSLYDPELSEQTMQKLLKMDKCIAQDLKNIQNGIASSLKQRTKPLLPKNSGSPVKASLQNSLTLPKNLPVIPETNQKLSIFNVKGLTSSSKALNKHLSLEKEGIEIEKLRKTISSHCARDSFDSQSHSSADVKTQSDYRSKVNTNEWLSLIEKNSSQESSLHITLKNDTSPKSFDLKEFDSPDQSFTEAAVKVTLRDAEEANAKEEQSQRPAMKNFIDSGCGMLERGTIQLITKKLSSKYGSDGFQKIDESLNESNNQTINSKFVNHNNASCHQEPFSSKFSSAQRGSNNSLVCVEYHSHGEVVSNSGFGSRAAKPTALKKTHKRGGSLNEYPAPEKKKGEPGLSKFHSSNDYSLEQTSTDDQVSQTLGKGMSPSSSFLKGSPLTLGTGSPDSINSAGSGSKQDSLLKKTLKNSLFKEMSTQSPAIQSFASDQSTDLRVYKPSEFPSNSEDQLQSMMSPRILEKSYTSTSKGKGSVFENAHVSIKSKYSLIEDPSQYQRCLKVVLFVRNKSASALTNFNVSFVVDPNLNFIKLPDRIDPSILPGKKVVIEFVIGVVKPSFTHLKIKCSACTNFNGKAEELNFKFAVPVTYNMFMYFQSHISSREFFSSWKDPANVILKGEPMIITNPQIKSPEDFTSVLGHLIIYPGLIDENGKAKAYSLMGIFELEQKNVEYLMRINWIPESRTAAFQIACHEENVIEGRFILQTLQSLFCHVKTIHTKR